MLRHVMLEKQDMFMQLSACMMILALTGHNFPVSPHELIHRNLPVVFEINGIHFAIFKEEFHFLTMPCLNTGTNIVFFDIQREFSTKVNNWLEKYNILPWKYIDEEERMYDWFRSRLGADPQEEDINPHKPLSTDSG